MNSERISGFAPQQSSAERENEKIKRDFELAKRASQNLKFGGGVQEGEDGALYTEIADIFVQEGLPELEESPLKLSYLGAITPAKFFAGTPESEAERLATIAKVETFMSMPEDKAEMIAFLEQSEVFKEWRRLHQVLWETFPVRKYVPVAESTPTEELSRDFHYDVAGIISELTRDDIAKSAPIIEHRAAIKGERAEMLLALLRNPEGFKEVYSRYDDWAKDRFDRESIPTGEDFDAFSVYGLTPEAYFQMTLSRSEVAIKENIKRDPFISKALSCLEVVDGKLQVQEGKEDIIKQLREAYNDDITPEQISLLLIAAETLFSEIRSKEEDVPGKYYGNGLEEQVVKLITGQPMFFKDFDHDGPNRYRTVFDPANIYQIETYSAKGNYPFHQKYAYTVYGQEGGDEVIKNLKYLGDVGERQAVEEQLASKTRGLFETDEEGARVAETNSAMFAYLKELVDKADKLNGPNDTVRHHRHFTKLTVDETSTALAYIKTEGSSDSSPYSSNPYASQRSLVTWKNGEEKFVSADGVTSFELLDDEGQTKLVKHLEDGTTEIDIIE